MRRESLVTTDQALLRGKLSKAAEADGCCGMGKRVKYANTQEE